jgi:hypothetical protein
MELDPSSKLLGYFRSVRFADLSTISIASFLILAKLS